MPIRRSGAGAAILLLAIAPFSPAQADPVDVRILLDGVRALSAPAGDAGAVSAFGPDAFAVVTGDSLGARFPVVAAAKWRGGRAVAVGHPGILSRDGLSDADNARFLANAVRWCARSRAGAVVAVVENPAAADILEQAGLAVVRWSVDQLRERMEAPDFEVAVVDAGPLQGKEGRRLAEFLTAFVKRGGGVVVGGRAADWRPSPGDRRAIGEHGANRLVAPMGMAWVDAAPARSTPTGWNADGRDLEAAEGRRALQALWNHASGNALPDDALRAAGTLLARTLRDLPPDEGWLTSRADAFAQRWAGAQTYPISLAQPAARLRAVLEWRRATWRAPDRQPAHPAATVYPGLPLASAAPAPVAARLEAGRAGRRFVGVYAPPGAVVEIAATPPAPTLRVRVGLPAPVLWERDVWERYPDVGVGETLGAAVRIASPFGGPVYLESDDPLPADVAVTVRGGIPMERVRRDAPRENAGASAPWTLWEGRVATLLLPVRDARRTDAPEPSIAVWDGALEALDRVLGADIPTARTLLVDPAPGGTGDVVTVPEALAPALAAPSAAGADTARVLALVARASLPTALRGPAWAGAAAALAASLALGGDASPTPADERARVRETVRTGSDAPGERELTELLLLARDAFGAELTGRALREAAKPDLAPLADRWLRALSRTLGRDLTPHFDAFRVPVQAESRALLSGLPQWSGLASVPAAPPPAR